MSGLAASSWRSIDTSTNLVRDKIERNDGVLDPFCLFTASSGNLKPHCSVRALTFNDLCGEQFIDWVLGHPAQLNYTNCF